MLLCSKTMKRCEWPGDCGINDFCNLIASQPYSANQEPAAPSLEQLEKDAARYRWLRDSDHDVLGIMAWYDAHSDPVCLAGPYADEAVDEAMTHTVQLTQD